LGGNCKGSSNSDLCYLPKVPYDVFFGSFPKIHLIFQNDQEFIWEAKYYLIEEKKNQFCFSIKEVSSKQITLGQTFMRGHEIYFDK
jgi:hypothetical protein